MNFEQTTRSVRADSFRGVAIAIVVSLALIAGWLLWFFRARVDVLSATATARVEVTEQARPLQARVDGRVVAHHLTLGARCGDGDVIVELDAEEQRRLLAQKEVKLAGLQPQIDALHQSIATEMLLLENDRTVAVATIHEISARFKGSEAVAELGKQEEERAKKLFESGLVSEQDFARSSSTAKLSRATRSSIAAEIELATRQQQKRDNEHRLNVEARQRELAASESDKATLEAEIKVLENDLEQLVIRAPSSGTIQQVAGIVVGSYVTKGQVLGVVVPEGDLRVVGEFPSGTASGRIQPGQKARIELDGFPWARYGAVTGVVTSVASEPRDGSVRVEVAMKEVPPSIPLQHGLPGTVRVEIESTSPSRLVLGQLGIADGVGHGSGAQ